MNLPVARSEFDLIRRYFVREMRAAGSVLGPGDDCALIAPSPGMQLAITTDMLVAGNHFLATADPRDLGWKALAVNLSDLAAMAARPRWALLAGSLPSADEAWLAAFSAGLFECAECFAVDLIGGDMTRGPLNLCLTAIGEVAAGQALVRHGARIGDELWVSGTPGRAALALAHLQERIELPAAALPDCLAALHRPQPRVDLGRALATVATAAIDVSDGLLADLGHILERSGVGGEVYASALPAPLEGVDAIFARDAQLTGGDDYELVFTAPPAATDRVRAIGQQIGLSLTRFGRIVAAPAGDVRVFDVDGNALTFARHGFDHFR